MQENFAKTFTFENNAFPLPKQYPSENVDDWKEDEIDSTSIIPEKTDEL